MGRQQQHNCPLYYIARRVSVKINYNVSGVCVIKKIFVFSKLIFMEHLKLLCFNIYHYDISTPYPTVTQSISQTLTIVITLVLVITLSLTIYMYIKTFPHKLSAF